MHASQTQADGDAIKLRARHIDAGKRSIDCIQNGSPSLIRTMHQAGWSGCTARQFATICALYAHSGAGSPPVDAD
jgi:hypothetical protein